MVYIKPAQLIMHKNKGKLHNLYKIDYIDWNIKLKDIQKVDLEDE